MWFNIVKDNRKQFTQRQKDDYDAGQKIQHRTEVEYAELGYPFGVSHTNDYVGKYVDKKAHHNVKKNYYMVAWRFSIAGLRRKDSLSMAWKHKEAAENIKPMPGTRYRATYDKDANPIEYKQIKPPESGMRWNYRHLRWTKGKRQTNSEYLQQERI
jgi:hypothetical protein